MKLRGLMSVVLSLALVFAALGTSAMAESVAPEVTVPDALLDVSDMFTSRDSDASYKESSSVLVELQGDTVSAASDAVSIDGGAITLRDAGTYILTGEWTGMIVVDIPKTDKVQLVLHNVSIHSETSAAIYIRQADKVFLTLAENTVNTLSNGGQFIPVDENNIDAVIFSKDDLTMNGTGSLSIQSPAGHGVVSKDDLIIAGGDYTVSAANHGFSGQDSVRILDGSFNITAGKDGLHAENDEDSDKGYLYIVGGVYAITSEGDGLSASGVMQLDGGTFTLQTGGGSTGQSAQQTWSRGFRQGASTTSDNSSVSAKGIKASGDLLLGGGTFQISAADDAVHSNSTLTVSGGDLNIATDDDGFHADGKLIITGGTIRITGSYEGIEGQSIDLLGGDIDVVSSDDGLNAAGGNDQSGFGGFRGKDSFASASDAYIHIAGGTLMISAGGDGIDSNGNLYVSGGETHVLGFLYGDSSTLDYSGEGIITGGIIMTAGPSQMSQTFGSASTQGVISLSAGMQSDGNALTLTDANGSTLLSWDVEQDYEYVVISCPDIVDGGTYTLTVGSESIQITMDGLLYGGYGGFGGQGGFGGGKGGRGR